MCYNVRVAGKSTLTVNATTWKQRTTYFPLYFGSVMRQITAAVMRCPKQKYQVAATGLATYIQWWRRQRVIETREERSFTTCPHCGAQIDSAEEEQAAARGTDTSDKEQQQRGAEEEPSDEQIKGELRVLQKTKTELITF